MRQKSFDAERQVSCMFSDWARKGGKMSGGWNDQLAKGRRFCCQKEDWVVTKECDLGLHSIGWRPFRGR